MGDPPADRGPDRRKREARFPWLALLILAGTVYAFWILPRQLPERPVKVEFQSDPAR